MLLDRDPDKEFGLTGLQDGRSLDSILDLVEKAAGAPIEREARSGPVEIRPEPIVDACLAAGERLRKAAEAHERVVLATGHPVGLAYLYHELAAWLATNGADVRTPAGGARWREPRLDQATGRSSTGIASRCCPTRASPATRTGPTRCIASWTPSLRTSSSPIMASPVPRSKPASSTIAIADVDDPALLVAQDQGRLEHVLVFDDHVDPNDYWPVFLALATPDLG